MSTTKNQPIRTRIAFALRHSVPTERMVDLVEARLPVGTDKLDPRAFGIACRKVIGTLIASNIEY